MEKTLPCLVVAQAQVAWGRGRQPGQHSSSPSSPTTPTLELCRGHPASHVLKVTSLCQVGRPSQEPGKLRSTLGNQGGKENTRDREKKSG